MRLHGHVRSNGTDLRRWAAKCRNREQLLIIARQNTRLSIHNNGDVFELVLMMTIGKIVFRICAEYDSLWLANRDRCDSFQESGRANIIEIVLVHRCNKISARVCRAVGCLLKFCARYEIHSN